MDGSELERFRAQLIERRDALQAARVEIDPLRDDTTDKVDDDFAPLNENAQIIASNRNRNNAKELALISGAIVRLDADPELFGLCEECEEPIPPRRLEVMPWAVYCVRCQSERESPRGGRRKSLRDYS